MEPEKKERSLVFWLVLLALMVAGVMVIFTLLGMQARMIRPLPEETEVVQPLEQETSADGKDTDAHAPNFCPFCGEKLNDSFQWGQFCPFCGEEVEQ